MERRLIDHLHLVVRDFATSRRFYQAALASIGVSIDEGGDDWFSAMELFVSTATSKHARKELTGRVHFAFAARDRDEVRQFHAAAIEAGGKDNGPPGERPYHAGYYAAFVLDPDGNNIEAVFHERK